MLKRMIQLVKNCGEKMLLARDIEAGVDEKEGAANYVTLYDGEIERYLKKELLLLLPEAHFLGEEEDSREKINSGYAFIVDPIDGTTNFIKHFSHSAISVGLSYDGVPILGVVYNPYLKDLFWAERGKGAWLNGKKISVSSHGLRDGVFLFGSTPYYPETADRTFSVVRRVFDYALDCRRTGSAALDRCYVACGRCELYFEVRISPWDYAASYLILEEAGGVISTMESQNESIPYGEKTSVVAGNPKAFVEFWSLMEAQG